MRLRALAFAVLLPVCPSARPPVLAAQGVDITAYHFRIDLPDTGSSIRGWASVFFDVKPGYDDTLRLDLVGMSVDRVAGMRSLSAIPYTYDGTVLKIVQRGNVQAVMVEYHGAPRDGLIYHAANARGHRSFFGDNWPNRARFWLPTVDHPSDKARVYWSVRAPRGMRLITNAGSCDNRRRLACLESQPMPTYTMVLGAAPMTVSVHRPAVGPERSAIPIEVWSYPEDSAFADSVPFRRATEIVEVMTRLIGPFPYSRLAHVESSTRYGGMENASAIFYDERAWSRGTLGEGTVRHETAHQWFGDAVTESDWHHVWLSESFATYFDAVVAGELDGDSAMQRVLQGDKRSYLASNVVNRPIIDTAIVDPNEVLNANTYPKGAWVLHMLRQTVGDSAFFGGLRDYFRTYRDSSVLTVALQRKVEQSSGQRLDWFFQQWLWQPGYPQLEARIVNGAISITQVQPGEWGSFRIPALPVALAGDGCPARITVAVLANRDPQSVTLPCAATGFTIDPDSQWLVLPKDR